MSGACPTDLAAGVIPSVLVSVDCQARNFAQLGYQALTGAAPFQVALTALLTIYVALLGYRLLFAAGGARLSDAPGIALKIGAILALVSSWALFQTLVFDVAGKAPLQLARLMAGPLQTGGGSSLALDPIGGLQVAFDQLSAAAQAFGRLAGPGGKSYLSGEAAAAQALAAAAGAMFMTTAGLIAVATLAVAVLAAMGPVFIALFLFRQTRGLFVGWVRAIIAAALAPMGAWALIVMMLSVLEPWLIALAQQRHDDTLDARTGLTAAAIVFVFAAAQICLALAGVLLAAGFRLGEGRRRAASPPGPAGERAAAPLPAEMASRPQRLAQTLLQNEAASTAAADRVNLTVEAAGAMARGRSGPGAAAAPRVGELYRRPGFQARRSAGGAP